jgi:hypothetical protein
MHGSIVMTIALAGLGGHNQAEKLSQPLPPASTPASTVPNPVLQPFVPSSYSEYYAKAGSYAAREGSYESPEYTSHLGSIRSTLWSLVLGRDPDVATSAEIEATIYPGQPVH